MLSSLDSWTFVGWFLLYSVLTQEIFPIMSYDASGFISLKD